MTHSTTMTSPQAARYLKSATAIRERCGQVFSLAEAGKLRHFALREERLAGVVAAVRDELHTNYPKGDVPYHSRWRHFSAGGVDRAGILDNKLARLPALERARAKLELAFISVLLDAGAGDRWCYRDAECRRSFGRSEGLAVASFDGFMRGLFGPEPCTVSGEGLLSASAESVGSLLQVSEANPILGLSGRASVLNQLGQVVLSSSAAFSGAPGRLGGMMESIRNLADRDGVVHASDLLEFVLDTFGPIWPGRISVGNESLGDVWRHSQVVGLGETDKLVPFHKLSQWLTYSLIEPLLEAGIRVGCLDELTGLAEYRNGGLLIDGGVLELRDPGMAARPLHPSSELIVEWRALTVSLLDRIASGLREQLKMTPEELPLAKVLQGGTWSLGRKLAAERRPHAAPPLTIESDGTVF